MTSPNYRTGSHVERKLIAAGLAVAFGSAALTGCASQVSAEGGHHSSSAKSGGSETYTGANVAKNPADIFERTDPLPSDLAGLQGEDDQAIDAAPKAEQIDYATWLGQYETAYVQRYDANNGVQFEQSQVELSPNSSPEDVFNAYLNVVKMGDSMESADADAFFIAHADGDLENNTALTNLIQNRAEQSISSKSGEVYVKTGDPIPVDWLSGTNFIEKNYANPTFRVETVTNAAGEQEKATIVTSTNSEGTKSEFALFVRKAEDYKGNSTYEVFFGNLNVLN